MREFQEIVLQFIERMRERHLADIEGATLDVTLPIREEFLNTAIELSMVGQETPVRRVRITIRNGTRIALDIEPKFFLKVHMELDLPEVTDFTKDPTIRLPIAAGSNVFAQLALGGASLFKQLPEGVTIANRQIAIHLPTLLERQNFGDLAPHLRYLIIAGRPGLLLFRLHARVAPASTPTRPSASVRSPGGR